MPLTTNCNRCDEAPNGRNTMRGIWISTALVTMALAASSASHAQFFSKTPQAADAPKTAAAPPQAPATAAPAPQAAPAPRAPCSNANALGVARTVEIDTTGGPGFGFEQYKAHDFLQPGEVVLTFDDGPWPTNKRGARCAGPSLHQGHVLHHRQARALLSGHSERGRGRRPYGRRPHLVARQPAQG